MDFVKDEASKVDDYGLFKKPDQQKKPSNFHKNKSADFRSLVSSDSSRFSENLGFNMSERAKFSSATSLGKYNKIFFNQENQDLHLHRNRPGNDSHEWLEQICDAKANQ